MFRKRNPRSHYILFLVYMILIFASEPLWRTFLFNKSQKIIRELQESHYEKNDNASKPLILHLAVFTSNQFIYGLLILIYNFSTIYKVLSLLISLFISFLIANLLKIIYISPRPFMEDHHIKPFDCEPTWGNPSSHSMIATALYISLWHIFFQTEKYKNTRFIKILSLIAIVAFISILSFERLIMGNHGINQLLFGILLGFGVYFFIFYVLNLDVEDIKQFTEIFNFKIIKTFIYISAYTIIILILYFLDFGKPSLEDYDIFQKESLCKDINITVSFALRSVYSTSFAFSLIGIFIGLKLDLQRSFNSQIEKYTNYNFSKVEKISDSDSDMSMQLQTRWNQTSFIVSIVRLIILIVLILAIFSPLYIIPEKASTTFFILYVFRNFLPMFLANLGVFYYFHVIFQHLRLTNIKISKPEGFDREICLI